jgi:hypothetical protein
MPDQTLKPFGSRTACPKCGSPHAYARWEQELHWFNPQGKQLTTAEEARIACVQTCSNIAHLTATVAPIAALQDQGFSRQYVEHIRRTCSRCGFTWDETPLDAKKGSQDA